MTVEIVTNDNLQNIEFQYYNANKFYLDYEIDKTTINILTTELELITYDIKKIISFTVF